MTREVTAIDRELDALHARVHDLALNARSAPYADDYLSAHWGGHPRGWPGGAWAVYARLATTYPNP